MMTEHPVHVLLVAGVTFAVQELSQKSVAILELDRAFDNLFRLVERQTGILADSAHHDGKIFVAHDRRVIFVHAEVERVRQNVNLLAVLEPMIFLPILGKFNRLALSSTRADDVADLLAVRVLLVVNFQRALG